MKTIYSIQTKGFNKTKMEITDCYIKENMYTSFKFSIPTNSIDTIIGLNDELFVFTFNKKDIPSIRRNILKQKKQELKT